jgi:Fe-S cluster biogenesis protein NfuA
MGDLGSERAAQAERRLERLDELPDGAVKEAALAAVQAIVELYGEGLSHIVEVLATRGEDGLAEQLADDELVAHLLLLHGLHPIPVEDRVEQALAGVLPYLRSHGGDAELIEVQDAVVRLRLQGSCSGCPSSAITLKHAIEEAIFAAAPDVEEVRADGATPPPQPSDGLIQLEIACPIPQR